MDRLKMKDFPSRDYFRVNILFYSLLLKKGKIYAYLYNYIIFIDFKYLCILLRIFPKIFLEENLVFIIFKILY